MIQALTLLLAGTTQDLPLLMLRTNTYQRSLLVHNEEASATVVNDSDIMNTNIGAAVSNGCFSVPLTSISFNNSFHLSSPNTSATVVNGSAKENMKSVASVANGNDIELSTATGLNGSGTATTAPNGSDKIKLRYINNGLIDYHNCVLNFNGSSGGMESDG